MLVVDERGAGKQINCPKCSGAITIPILIPKPVQATGKADAPISFFCPQCGKNIVVGAEEAGHKVFCPQCGKDIITPNQSGEPFVVVGERQEPEQPKIFPRSHSSSAAITKKQCPKCQHEVEAEAVICVNCGFNLRTGRWLGAPTTLPEHLFSYSNLRRFAIPLTIVFLLLLGCLCWGVSKVKDYLRAQELAQRIGTMETEYSALTSKVSRSMADLGNICSDMQTLAQKAAFFNLPNWKTRCEEYSGKMEARKIALNGELLSLSNGVASLELKGEFRAAIKLLREYKGEFSIETEDFRNKLATTCESKASQREAEVRKAEEERQKAEDDQRKAEEERSKVADTIRAEKEAAEKEIAQRKLLEEQYAKLREQSIKAFVSPVGRHMRLGLISGGSTEGVVKSVADNSVTIILAGGAASINREQMTAETCKILFVDAYADSEVNAQKTREKQAEIFASNTAKGLVQVNGQWMTPAQAKEIAPTRCPKCKGTRTLDVTEKGNCFYCWGEGKNTISIPGPRLTYRFITCNRCAGTGQEPKIRQITCDTCRGKGSVTFARASEIAEAEQQKEHVSRSAWGPISFQSSDNPAKSSGGYYGKYRTRREAQNAADALNANQQGSIDSAREMGGTMIGNFQVRRYQVHFDEQTGLWVVY